jgi:hypothetical protein
MRNWWQKHSAPWPFLGNCFAINSLVRSSKERKGIKYGRPRILYIEQTGNTGVILWWPLLMPLVKSINSKNLSTSYDKDTHVNIPPAYKYRKYVESNTAVNDDATACVTNRWLTIVPIADEAQQVVWSRATSYNQHVPWSIFHGLQNTAAFMVLWRMQKGGGRIQNMEPVTLGVRTSRVAGAASAGATASDASIFSSLTWKKKKKIISGPPVEFSQWGGCKGSDAPPSQSALHATE